MCAATIEVRCALSALLCRGVAAVIWGILALRLFRWGTVIRLLTAKAAGGRRTVRLLPAGAAHSAHADAYRAGLSGALRLGLAGGERIALTVRKIGGGEEHKGRVVDDLACIKHRTVAVRNGKAIILCQQRRAAKAALCGSIFPVGELFAAGWLFPIRLSACAGLPVLHIFTRHFRRAAEDHAGLRCRKVHAHTAAAARRQHRAAGNGHRAIRVQRLVVRSVGRPDGHAAAGDRQVAVGIKAVTAVGVCRDRPAEDVQFIGIAAQVGIGGVDAVVC